MKLTLGKVNQISITLIISALLCGALGYQWLVFSMAALILLIGVIVLGLRYWRCPHCGNLLGRGKPQYCPSCGEKLDYDMELPKK